MNRRSYSYGRQSIGEDDIDAVVDTLRGSWLTQGPKVAEFEQALASKLRAKYAVAVSSGTAALHLSALALGWKPGEVVITSPLTFLASANCIVYAGATPDFVDIDSGTYTIDVNQLESKIAAHRKAGRKVKAVIGVDYAGYPCDWKSLRELADRFRVQLVADSCHAVGAEIDGDPGYAARYADAVILSFHPVKHITTGEGGAVLTNSAELDGAIRMLRTHGITRDPAVLERNDGPWYYEMHDLGFNYRVTDFQCALGLTQLAKLDNFLTSRSAAARYYDKAFESDERFIVPRVQRNVTHAYHLYPLQIDFSKTQTDKMQFFASMKNSGIMLQVHYVPVHTQPYYMKNYGFSRGDFPVAESFYKREVSIPMYPGLQPEDLEYIVERIKTLAR